MSGSGACVVGAPSTPASPPNREPWDTLARWAPALLCAVTAAGAALRFWGIGSKGLWLDEAFSIWLARQPVTQMLSWVVHIDQHPPLYYLLLHSWMALGDSEATVRALSALCGTLTIPVLYLIGRRLLGQGAGLLAAFFLAVAPFHVWFAQEARMYAVLTLWVALAVLALAHILTNGGRSPGAWWVAYVVCTAAAILTHHTALFFPLAANAFVFGFMVWRRRIASAPGDLQPPRLRSWLWAQAGVLLLWAPWAVPFVAQAKGVYREFWIPKPSPGAVLFGVGNLLNAHAPRQQLPFIDGIWLVFLLLLALGVAALRRRSPALLGFLLALAVVPLAGELLVSLRLPIFYDRTLIWITLPAYLLMSAGIVGLRRRWLGAALTTLVVVANLLSVQEFLLRFQKEGWREAAAFVAEGAEPGDLLLFNATWVQIPFDYYFEGAGPLLEERGAPVDLFERGLEPKMTAGDLPRLRALLAGRPRVWLVYSHNWYTDPQALVPATLAEELRPTAARDFPGLEVRLYEAR